jgi:hypothetical protein
MLEYRRQNDLERARLMRLLDQVGTAEMQRTLPNGWTVAAALAHLAFWDRYAVGMLTEWGAKGFRAPATQIQELNVAVEKMSHLIALNVLLEWVRTSAEEADKAAAEASAALVAAIEAGGQTSYLQRSVHRHHHVVQLEAVLGVM